MLIKEDIVPFSADQTLHFLAPLALTVPVWLAFAVLPFGRNMSAIELDAGILFFFAIGSASELAVFMAGWSSQNKYSLVGAMRAIAQMISYEVPLVLASVPVLMAAGSLSLPDIVQAQSGFALGCVPRWNVFTPWGLAGFALFLIAAAAESNRCPFDLPEGESELIAGYLTEYSGFKYALFFLGEYLGLFAVTGLAVTLFLGGWQAPAQWLEWLPSWGWFAAKFSVADFSFHLGAGDLAAIAPGPIVEFRLEISRPARADQSVRRCRLVESSRHAMAIRWLLCAGLLAVPYVWLGRNWNGATPKQRQYSYAE